MVKILQIYSNINRPSGVKTFIDNLFKQSSLKGIGVEDFDINSILKLSGFRNLMSQLSRVNVVYCHELYNVRLFLLVFLIAIYKKKLVIVSHGSFIVEKHSNSKFLKRVYLGILKICCQNLRVVIHFLNSTELKRSVKIVSEYVVCPPYLDYQQSVRKNRSVGSDVRLAYIGAFYPVRKGLDLLLHYMSDISSYHNNVSLSLIGVSDSQYKQMCEWAGCEENSEIKPIGRLSNGETISYLDKVSATVLLARSEGWPIAIYESIINHIPVIVSEGTNISDLISRNGIGYVATDKESFLQAITYLKENEIPSVSFERAVKELHSEKAYSSLFRVLSE